MANKYTCSLSQTCVYEQAYYLFNIHTQNYRNNQDSWSKWNLTLIGKITVLKTFAVPKLIYPLTVIESPSEAILKEVETSMFKFLWNCKPDKIKRDQIIQDYNDGGLKMIDILEV